MNGITSLLGLAAIATLVAMLTACGPLHSLVTPHSKSAGMTPMQHTSVGNTTDMTTPYPGLAVETANGAAAGQPAYTYTDLQSGVLVSQKDYDITDLEVITPQLTLRAGKLSAKASTNTSAMAAQLAEISNLTEKLKEAQVNRDKAAAEVAVKGLEAATRVLIKIALGGL